MDTANQKKHYYEQVDRDTIVFAQENLGINSKYIFYKLSLLI